MAEGARDSPLRYSAFISYTHRDVAAAKRLQQQLETYRLPARVALSAAPGRLRGRRLKPIFRDISDLSAAHDLTAAIQEALAQSDNLIVVCSPRSAQSEWVGREIEYFRALHGDVGVRAARVEGTTAEALHPALRSTQGGEPIEPLAADFTKAGPGGRLALLKLVASLAKVELDELVHRDSQRQLRRIAVAASVAAVVTLSVGALGGLTLTAQADAERRRTETTGLVEYMLTDLRKSTQRTGRLDQLAALNDGAMQYYRHQDLKRLSEAQLRQRAKLLQAMGEDDEKRGKLTEARESFDDAHRTTAALLAAKPNDPKRVFAHAQSEYWVGFINWRNGDATAARKGFEAYAALAGRLVELEPRTPAYLSEAGYAETNLGLLAMRQAGDLSAADRHFKAALRHLIQVTTNHDAPAARQDVADAYSWMAEGQRLRGRLEEARTSRLKQRDIILGLKALDQKDVQLDQDLITNDFALARIDAAEGKTQSAIEKMLKCEQGLRELWNRDQGNRRIHDQVLAVSLFRTRLQLARNHKAADLAATLSECDRVIASSRDQELSGLCLLVSARLARMKRDYLRSDHLLGKLSKIKYPDRYTKRWGLDFNDEIERAQNMET